MRKARIAASAVGFDERDPSGLNRYTAGVLDGLMQSGADVVAYATSPVLREAYPGRVRAVRPRTLSQSNFKGNLLRLAWYQFELPGALRRAGASVLYSPVPEGMVSPPCRQVITVHDLLPLRFPEVYPRLRYYFRHVLPRIIRASSALVVDSQATAEDVRGYYDPVDIPIHVVYPGFDPAVFRSPDVGAVERVKSVYHLDRFVLSVGETRPYKNIRRLIEAFAGVPVPELQLAIVGKSSKMDPDLASLPVKLGVSQRVKFLGYVPDQELAALYAAAAAFVFPSLHEGFGFPALEAMACGSPVVASNAASLPEVCGDAAEYVDPTDADSIAAGLHRVVADPALQQRLRDAGRERSRCFSYRAAADGIMQVIAQQL